MVEPKKRAGDTLLAQMQTHVMKKAALPSDRRQDVIHPSELCKEDVCPRKIVYRISGTPKDFDSEVHGIGLQTIFQEGHDVHSKFQIWLQEMGVLWGNWRCKGCDMGYVGLSADLDEVDDTSGLGFHRHVWDYREVPIDGMDKYLIYGHGDGAVGTTIIEVKTIGLGTVRMEEPALISQYTVKTVDGKSVVDIDSLWKNLSRPLISHRKQAGIYLRLMQEAGHPFETITFIYENKSNQQVKQFVTKYEPYLVDPLLDIAKDIKWAVENKRTLPIPTDLTADSKTCRACEWRTTCRPGGTDAAQDEQDTGTGPGKSGGQEEDGSPADPPTHTPRRRSAGTTRRPNELDRQCLDEPLHTDDGLVGIPRQPTGSSRGRRTVRRSSR